MPIKVMLADDSVPAQNMGKKILLDAGFDVVTASNGLEALRKISESAPDVAILDIFMPGYTGLELCSRLRSKAETADLPVILTVGRLEPYRPEQGEEVHSNAVIVKPFAASELTAAVRSLTAGPKPHQAESSPEPESAPLQSDPLQESGAAETDPLAEAAAETPHSKPEEFQLSANAPAAKETLDPLGSESPLDPSEPTGPEALAFNPDAGHTPFSASTADFVTSAKSSGLADFDELDVAEFPAPEQQEPLPESAAGSPPNEALLGDFEEAQVHSAEHLHEDGSPLESEPLLEVQETKAEEAASGQPSEEQQEEARRLAFEQLFNSSELPPLERYDGSDAGDKILPSMATLPHDHSSPIEPDPELEPQHQDGPAESIHGSRDPFLLEDLEPLNSMDQIPNHDSLLDRGPEPEWGAAKRHGSQEPAEPLGLETNETPLSTPEVQPDPMLMPAMERPGQSSTPELHQDAAPFAAPTVEISEPESAPAIEAAPEQAPAWDEDSAFATPLDDIAETVVAKQPEPECEPLELQVPAEAHAVSAIAETEAAPEPEPMPLEPVSEEFLPETAVAAVPELADTSIPVESFHQHLETQQSLASLEHSRPGPIAEKAFVEPQAAKQAQPAVESHVSELASELTPAFGDPERVQQAVDRVFDRFKRLLVTAIVRELARHD